MRSELDAKTKAARSVPLPNVSPVCCAIARAAKAWKRMELYIADDIAALDTAAVRSRVFHRLVRSGDSLVRPAVRFRADNSSIIIHAWPEIGRRPALGGKIARSSAVIYLDPGNRTEPPRGAVNFRSETASASPAGEENIFGAGPRATLTYSSSRPAEP